MHHLCSMPWKESSNANRALGPKIVCSFDRYRHRKTPLTTIYFGIPLQSLGSLPISHVIHRKPKNKENPFQKIILFEREHAAKHFCKGKKTFNFISSDLKAFENQKCKLSDLVIFNMQNHEKKNTLLFFLDRE